MWIFQSINIKFSRLQSWYLYHIKQILFDWSKALQHFKNNSAQNSTTCTRDENYVLASRIKNDPEFPPLWVDARVNIGFTWKKTKYKRSFCTIIFSISQTFSIRFIYAKSKLIGKVVVGTDLTPLKCFSRISQQSRHVFIAIFHYETCVREFKLKHVKLFSCIKGNIYYSNKCHRSKFHPIYELKSTTAINYFVTFNCFICIDSSTRNSTPDLIL